MPSQPLRPLGPSLAFAAQLLLGIAGTFGTALPAQEEKPRPNILLLVTDDQRWDAMRCAGNALAITPNLDALANDGVRFRNAFVTTAICAASRASILTGRYERSHRSTFGTPPLREDCVVSSYPVQLRNAGYRTGFVGKFGVGTTKGDPARMFDSFAPLGPGSYWQKQPDGSQRHFTDITGDRAVAFLASCTPDQPWCLSISFNAPHAVDGDPQQYFWPKAMDTWYADTVFPVPKTMAPEHFAAQQPFLQTSESRTRFLWRFDEPEKYQTMVRGYYRMISGVDAVIGRLRKELQTRGLADNTVIVFCSDNGYFLGERGFADKWYAYEPSVRIPLILADPRLPDIRKGTTCDLMALNVDLAPTVLDLAALQAPKHYQGHSLMPLVRGRAPVDWRTDFFYEHLFHHKSIPKSEGVRTERFTYLRWFESDPLQEELYDHQADFDEVQNLVHVPAYAEVLAKLRTRTDALRDQYAAAMPASK